MSNAVLERFARWRPEGLSVCALQTALTYPGGKLCAAATASPTRMSVPCWWPVAWDTPTWRSCTREIAKVSICLIRAISKLNWSALQWILFLGLHRVLLQRGVSRNSHLCDRPDQQRSLRHVPRDPLSNTHAVWAAHLWQWQHHLPQCLPPPPGHVLPRTLHRSPPLWSLQQ